jgi:hypothetical protein
MAKRINLKLEIIEPSELKSGELSGVVDSWNSTMTANDYIKTGAMKRISSEGIINFKLGIGFLAL